ncbi:MAG: GAF domain-containing sensor histidine kinase [Halodesulfurarchaeum sp.]|nr:GAF domain-containing sensor histidine kinase [Halodesulfurarchaeum sp.]
MSLSDEEARNELYALLHRPVSRKEAFERILEVGAEYLDIDHGHITDIDETANRWEVISSNDDPDGPYPEGLSVDLDETYCRRTFQQSTPIALHNAGEQGWADNPAYKRHRLETYLGIRVEAFDEPYGTLCFVEEQARAEPFTEAEQFFLELAGQVLRTVLEETHQEKVISNRDRLIAILNRVLRHNLRNDLTVVQGYAGMLADQTESERTRWATKIGQISTELISLADKSRKLETLTRDVPVPRPTDIVPLLEETVERVRMDYPDADLVVDAPAEAITYAAPALSTAIEELLENAVTHGGPEVSVRLAISQTDSQTVVRVEDDGPGLSGDERRVLLEEDETALEHGSGLGLALVHWVLTNLEGTIEVSGGESGTAVELRLPRGESVSKRAEGSETVSRSSEQEA